MMSYFKSQWIFVVIAILLCGFQQDDSKRVGNTANRKQNERAKAPKVTENAESRKLVLLDFVQQHHPDLRKLLDLLESRKPAEYRKAMKELSKQYDRLQAVKKRDPDKYRIALRYWKVHSRIEVMSAQVALKGAENYETKLKELIRQKLEIRIQLQKYEEARLQERLQRVRENLKNARQSIDSDVERQIRQIKNSGKSRAQRRSNDKGK